MADKDKNINPKLNKNKKLRSVFSIRLDDETDEELLAELEALDQQEIERAEKKERVRKKKIEKEAEISEAASAESLGELQAQSADEAAWASREQSADGTAEISRTQSADSDDAAPHVLSAAVGQVENADGDVETDDLDDEPLEKKSRKGLFSGLRLRLQEQMEMNEKEFFEGDYEEGKKRWTVARRLRRYIFVAAAVLGAVILILLVSHFWTYSSYRVLMTKDQEDTLSVTYARMDNEILRYGREGASLFDLEGNALWDYNYTMEEPKLAVCESAAAVYDTSGTTVAVMNEDGGLGTFNTEYPIVKADVTADGRVAAILEDGNTTWIQYYEANGEKIVSMRTTIDSPGYPLDLSLSHNGMLMAVSYLAYSDNEQKCIVDFYNFGTIGQNRMDNQIAEYEYPGTIIPEVEYLNNSTCIAFADDGFHVYRGSRIPEETKSVTVNSSIISTFYDDHHVGLMLATDDSRVFQMQVYDRSGDRVLSQQVDFAYENIEIVNNEIDLYNGNKICVYQLSGVKKFEGQYESAIKEIISVGEHRFLIAEEERLRMIKLR